VSNIDIREVDRTDETQLHAWWSAGHAAMSHRPVDLWPDWEVSRLSLPEIDLDNRVVLLGAYAGDAMVGSGLAYLPLKDNTHLGMLDVYVPPDQRRRGIGSALLDRAESIIVADGRTTLLSDVRVPVDEDSDDRRWAEARGYAVANVDTVKVSTWPRPRTCCRSWRRGPRSGWATTGWPGGPTPRPRSTWRRWRPR